MKRLAAIGICIIIFTLLLPGCRPFSKAADPAEAPAGHTVTDSKGHVLKLAQKPRRIVPLSAGANEIVMGLVPADRIAALTNLADDAGISNITEEAKRVPARVRANADSIISQQPDIVIIPDWQPAELIDILRDAGVAVYVYQSPYTIAQIRETVAIIAGVVGEEEAGRRIVSVMDEELAAIAEKVKMIPPEQRKVVVRFSLMGGSDGQGSTFDDICHHAGVKNGAAMAGLGRNGLLSKEQIVEIDPDIFLIPTWDYTGKTDMEKFKADVQADAGLQTIKAIKQKRLVQVPDRYLYCSSQYIVYGVRAVAAAAYPGNFGP
ncbi:MAG TPA: ABC transporter substrate-binding protein [Negativicutes bacterium]|nr:ABC transporter substrate-binding protein [Negativicutes bacterium]